MNKSIGKLEQISPVCFQHTFNCDSYHDKFRLAIFGDPHIDSMGHCGDLFKEILSQCADTNTPVIIIGDLFDAMQGRSDRRHSKQALTQDDIGESPYFNNIIEKVANIFEPYIGRIPWILSLKGNHETAIEKYNEIDLMQILKYSLFKKGYDNFHFTGYRTYLKSLFVYKKRKYGGTNLIGGFHHGFGGARRSKGILNVDINKGMYGSVDYFCTGHTHEQWSYPSQVLKLDNRGYEYKKEVLFMQVPSFKEDITNVNSGYAVEKSFQPLPIGGYWLNINMHRKQENGYDMKGYYLREVRM